MNYRIGIIEDDPTEASEMMLSVIRNGQNYFDESSFSSYDLENTPELRTKLYEKIERDIKENVIQCLIVDYKLDTLKEVLSGAEIVQHFHVLISEFPVIVLTNVPEQGKTNDLVDPDKVYSKKYFLNPNRDETREMVGNIIQNIQRYAKKRAELELEREDALDKVVNAKKDPTPEEEAQLDKEYSRLYRSERELSLYAPINLYTMEKEHSVDSMNAALRILEQFKELLK